MPYLIDGHNLIPRVGLRLDSLDDELDLVTILQEFARLGHHQVEVYFDGAPAGHAGARKLGAVQAHFVRLGQTADSAIRMRLQKMGKSARNWTVVSSDREVREAALTARARSMTSEEFVKSIRRMHRPSSTPVEERSLTKAEVEEWLKLFQQRKG